MRRGARGLGALALLWVMAGCGHGKGGASPAGLEEPGAQVPVAWREAWVAMGPEARAEAAEAASWSEGAGARAVDEAALAALEAKLPEAQRATGMAHAFRSQEALRGYLKSLLAGQAPEAYDREGFLAKLGLGRPLGPGRTDEATFAGVLLVEGYSPGNDAGQPELKSQVLAWRIAKGAPGLYRRLARVVNPFLEAQARWRKAWAKPFLPLQVAHPMTQPATERYAVPAALASFRLRFDPDLHTGAPGTPSHGNGSYGTYSLARGLGFSAEAAEGVGRACNAVDEPDQLPYLNTHPLPSGSLDRHFNLDRKGQDTRYVWAQRHLDAAIAYARARAYREAELELGVGLHSLQDSFAHGQLSPYLHGTIGEYPDDLRYHPLGYLEVAEATRAYLKAYQRAVLGG